MASGDPKGYYATLGVTPGASAPEIRAAYRRLAKETHPDSRSPNASTARFRDVAEAYETLNDAKKRSAYDNSNIQRGDAEKREPITPIVCSQCSKIAVQPRYIVFWNVVSYIVGTTRTPIQGLFCSACARKTAWSASLLSAFFGWWGIPWGPLFTFPTILANAFGGERRREIEDDLLWHNAVAFTLAKQYDLAYALARIVRKSKDEDLALRALRLIDALEKSGTSSKTPPLKNAWSFRPIATAAQSSLAFALPALAFFLMSGGGSAPYSAPYSGPPPTYADSYAPASPVYNATPVSPLPVFDAIPVPITTGEIRFAGTSTRLAPLQIVTQVGTNYFVKLINVSTGQSELFAFIKGGEVFEAQMPLGTYEMRYASGDIWYGESILFGPNTRYTRADEQFHFTEDYQGYSGYTVELIMRTNGNLDVDPISASQF